MRRDDREVAMSKTILGSIVVVFCGVLLMPLLVEPLPLATAVSKPAVQQITIADFASGQ
jgi:hypothetical protein